MISEQPANSANAERRADFLNTQGRFPEAEQCYREVLQREPGRLDIQARLGRLCLLQNRPPEAIELLAGVINQGLRNPADWEALANAYLVDGQTGPAALCYENAGRTGLAGTLAALAEHELCRISGTAAVIELDWLSGTSLPVVQAQIRGQSVNLLVDTAAGDLLLDEKLAVAVGIPHGGQELLHFAGGLSARVTYGHVDRLQLGGLVVHDALTQILDLNSRFSAYTPNLPIHGILGIRILSNFQVIFDFRRRLLRLLPAPAAAGKRLAQDMQLHLPFWVADNQFVLVQAQTPDRQSALWVIDTGMSGGAFAVSRASAEAVGLKLRFGAQEQGIGGGGALQGQRATLPALCLDTLYRQEVDGFALERLPLDARFGFQIAGLLGCDFFHDTVLRLDFPRRRLSIDER